ncbi:MAG: pilus assembly protein PilM [Phycisphaerales bacterium]|nr:pilus assembly protein PilM [Phycisphaerales bacterium]
MNFLSQRFRSTTGHVGIAFEDDGVRMVQVSDHRGHISVTGAAWIPLQGQDAAPGSLAESIRAAFVTGGFTGRRCVVSMPRSEVWTQVAKMPEMPDSELDEAIAWEAAERFGVARESLECDWMRVSSEASKEVFIIAADRGHMQPRLEAVLAAGLRPVAVDTDFGGVARLYSRRFRRDVDASRARVVLDVGYSGSMLLILKGRQIVFCKPVPIGGRHFDQRVAERLDIDPLAAAELRQARMNNVGTLAESTDGAVSEAIRPVLAELGRESMLCLRHFSVSVRGDRLDHLVVSGAHAMEPGLAELLNSACRLSVQLDDESACMADLQTGLAKAMPGLCGPPQAWAAATGLSLRGVTGERKSGRRAA